jgi:hypothetical protein
LILSTGSSTRLSVERPRFPGGSTGSVVFGNGPVGLAVAGGVCADVVPDVAGGAVGGCGGATGACAARVDAEISMMTSVTTAMR